MPIYEYSCTACGERTEAKQSFDDAPLDTCEVCGGKLRKLYSPVGIVFKGSGFYATDARSKAGANSDAKGDDKSGKAKKADTKPAKTESKTSEGSG